MQVTFSIKDLTPFPMLTDPTMIFPTIYFENQLYAASVPHTTFSEGTFCQTSATISLQGNSKDIIEKFLKKSFYVVLNSIYPGKKAKKPADGISYSDLLLAPFSQFSEVKIDPLVGEEYEEYLTQKLQLQFNVFTNSVLFVDVDFRILNYKKLNYQPFNIAIGGIQIPGNLKNVKSSNFKGLVPCNYQVEIELPCQRKLELVNGYFSTVKNEVLDSIENIDDILTIAQNQFNYINFPQVTSFVDNQLADQSFLNLYQVIGDAKGFEKMKQVDYLQYQQKFTTFAQQQVKQADFVDILNILKEAISSSFTQAILLHNDQVISSNTDPKKKIDPKNFVQQVNFTIETMPTFLLQEQFVNNYSTYLLSDEEAQQLRNNLTKKAKINIKPSQFWASLDVIIEDFECTCEMDFSEILRKQIISQDIKLEMTEQQIEKQNKIPEIDPKDKKKTQPSQYYNIITSNYGLMGISLSLKHTELIRSEKQIIQSIYEAITPANKLILKNKTFLTKRMVLDSFLPPSLDSMTPIEQVCFRLREDIKEAYARSTQDSVIDVLKPFVKKYMNEINQIMPNTSMAEKHAIIMSNSQQAVKQLNINEKSAEELINFGEVLIQSQNIQDAQRAQLLFGSALTRERRSRSQHQHTVLLEQAVLGGLKCAIISKNTQLLMRSLIRAYSLSQILNESKLYLFELSMLGAAELVALGENPEFALTFLHFYKDIYSFELENVQESIMIKTLSYCLLELLQNKLFKELELILTDYIRKVNKSQEYFSAITKHDSDEVIIVNLKLALCEWLILRGSSRFASIVLQNMQNEFQIQNQVQQVSKFTYMFDERFSCDKDLQVDIEDDVEIHIDQKRHFHIIQTKSALLSARILYIEGYFNEMRNVLLKQLYQQKQPKTSENNPLKILSYLQSDESLDASFLDLIEPILDQVPGVLASVALSCVQNHKVPQFLKHPGKLPQLLVCAAIQGRLPSKQQLAISTHTSFKNLTDSVKSNYTPTQKKKQLFPDDMIISNDLAVLLSDQTFSTILFNSRVSFDMALQSLSLAAQSENYKGYCGILDCKTLSIDLQNDQSFVFALSRLSIRYLPLLDLVAFPRPFSPPSDDEINVAKRIFHQIQPNLTDFTPNYLKNQLTTDYLAEIQIKNPLEILEILTSLTSKYINLDYQNPRQLSTSGMLYLYQNDFQTALSCFQRTLQLDSTESTAWRGISLILAHNLTLTEDDEFKNQIRVKICECVNRSSLPASGEIAVAIAQSLLNPHAERATYYALLASKILKSISLVPQLMPIIAFSEQIYQIEFSDSRASESQWYINRLLAIANKSCGRPEDVAGYLNSALKGIGGIRPGRSVIEIAERILIMTETAQAWNDAGNSENAEKVMAEGLM
ncbi:hypothetical protein SS50377_25686 [Spironucleus salmonicida]|uniref:Uncharacterized protein n=1 Tax=Spironucleus salmonicida TaxID=348837 RepID=V6LE19_9EUKA|nr:hypothetical protein SS50377_25686 [Spironucleus salmonicida]|eukprot:EST42712.1 hypothetical protein SS50377_17735 [Spironucleus salmonicida]